MDQGRIQGITDEQFESSIDLHGDYVIPAFVNAHCHLGDTGAKELGVGLTLEEAVVYPNGLKHKYLAKITSEELTEAVRDGLKEMLKNGIILAADYREGGLPSSITWIGKPFCACRTAWIPARPPSL